MTFVKIQESPYQSFYLKNTDLHCSDKVGFNFLVERVWAILLPGSRG